MCGCEREKKGKRERQEKRRLENDNVLFQLPSLLPVFNTLLEKMEGGASSARLAIGQAIAVLFELTREVDSDLLESADSCETYSLIEQLATESSRYTARKERNQLRAHFRDVLQTLNVSESHDKCPQTSMRHLKYLTAIQFLNTCKFH